MTSSSTLRAIAALALAACLSQQAAAAAITEAEAGKIADDTAAAWASMDAAKIKALYAPSIVAFDFAIGPLEADRATFDKAQEVYAAQKIDKVFEQERMIQILGPNVFVVSGTWAGTSTAKPANNGGFRCTDVYWQGGDAKWKIVNEHCSMVPKG